MDGHFSHLKKLAVDNLLSIARILTGMVEITNTVAHWFYLKFINNCK